MNTHYSFDTSLAIKYGQEESVILANFIYWINKSRANNKHFYDGYYWTYNSVFALSKLFPFWTSRQINRIINSLIKQGAIKSGNYNKMKYDRSLWYSIMDKSILPFGEMEDTKWVNENDQMVKPIPDNKPDNKPDKENANAFLSEIQIATIVNNIEKAKPDIFKIEGKRIIGLVINFNKSLQNKTLEDAQVILKANFNATLETDLGIVLDKKNASGETLEEIYDFVSNFNRELELKNGK